MPATIPGSTKQGSFHCRSSCCTGECAEPPGSCGCIFCVDKEVPARAYLGLRKLLAENLLCRAKGHSNTIMLPPVSFGSLGRGHVYWWGFFNFGLFLQVCPFFPPLTWRLAWFSWWPPLNQPENDALASPAFHLSLLCWLLCLKPLSRQGVKQHPRGSSSYPIRTV